MSGKLLGLIVIVLFQAVLAFMPHRHAEVDFDAGSFVLEYPTYLRLMLKVAAIGLIGAALYLVTFFEASLLIRVALSVMVGAGGVMATAYSNARITVTAEGIKREIPWWPTRTISWGDIGTIKYSFMGSCFTIRSRTGGKIRVLDVFTGLPTFHLACAEQLEPEQYERAFDKAGISGF